MNLNTCEGLFLKLLRGGNVVLIACFLRSGVSGPGTEKCVCPTLPATWESRRARSALGQGPHEVQSDRAKCEKQETWTRRLVSRKLALTLGRSLAAGACVPRPLSAGRFTAPLRQRGPVGESSLASQMPMQLLRAVLPALHDPLLSSESLLLCEV